MLEISREKPGMATLCGKFSAWSPEHNNPMRDALSDQLISTSSSGFYEDGRLFPASCFSAGSHVQYPKAI